MGGRGTGISQERDRMHRINEIWEMINNHPSWEKEKVIAKFQFKYGTSRRTVLDYLKLLENLGKISW